MGTGALLREKQPVYYCKASAPLQVVFPFCRSPWPAGHAEAGYNGAMPIGQRIFDNADAALDAAQEVLAESLAAGGSPVLLVPSSAAVLRVREALAGGPCGLGVRVETPDTWIADRWELLGDGRRLVTSAERNLLVQRALYEEASGGGAIVPSPGTVELASTLARDALPQLLATVRADDTPSGLSEAESAMLNALGRYATLLAERGMAEAAQAAASLPELMEDVPFLLMLGFDGVPCAIEQLVETLSDRTPAERFDDACRFPPRSAPRASELRSLLERLYAPGAPVEPTGAVRFLLPAGRYAAPALVLGALEVAVAREREEALEEGRSPLSVVVAARDPRALFDEIAPALLARGMTSAVAARRAFADTAFGRAFLALLAVGSDNAHAASRAADFALSPFSGLSLRSASDLDATWRGDRLADAATIRRDLTAASEAAADAFAALDIDDFEAAVAAFERSAARLDGRDPAFRSEQLAAMGAARRFAAASAGAGVAPLEALSHLERASVPAHACTSAEGGCEEAPAVRFMTLDDAAELPACSCSTLVVCDLEASSYPVRAAEDGATLLMEKLDLRCPVDALAESRRRFFRALSAPRACVVCERALNTSDADEAYPAVMLEELLDCYRSAGGEMDADARVDRATGLPEPLASFAQTAGEETLHANLVLAPAYGESLTWDVPVSGAVDAASRARIVLPPPNAAADAAPTLSPSAVESYLECPYKWFALRRLRTSEPDAAFGPKEKGSFSHAVLKRVFERFGEEGFAKVGPDNLERARAVFGEVFDERLAAQRSLRPKDNPLIARTKLEEAELDDLRRKLAAFIEREPLLLPGFEPAHFEFDFGAYEPFEYADCLLRGSIDRIDVNGCGQAVVIDYKGSLSSDYALSSSSPAVQAAGAVLPHKVQALMYAQVARRLLGLDVVGALYVSYAKPKAAGAVNRTALGEHAVPGISIEACGVPGPAADALGAESFGGLIDLVEERVALAARSLLEGHIAPEPRGGNPCGYCPVLACEKRSE